MPDQITTKLEFVATLRTVYRPGDGYQESRRRVLGWNDGGEPLLLNPATGQAETLPDLTRREFASYHRVEISKVESSGFGSEMKGDLP